jgi:ribosomal protein L37AE/L43A
MPSFQDFQKHCTACRQGEPCGQAHLYVIKLEKSIWAKKQRFRDANPHYDVNRSRMMLYVGKTSDHVPRCRQSQHQRYEHGTWVCYCGFADEQNAYSFYHRPSPFIKGFTKGHFRPELFRDWNPVTRETVEQKEAELAKSLREQGYAVWSGHHETT